MIGFGYQSSFKKQQISIQKTDLQTSMYKTARYIHVILKNCEKIDQAKSLLFNDDFDLSLIFQTLDFKNKGFIDENDLKKIIVDNGADPKVVKLDRIMKYFGSNSIITKQQLLKALVLPSWKLNIHNQNFTSNKQKPDSLKKLLFKFILAIYLAMQQDGNQRNKLKDVNIEQVFYQISEDKEYLRIDELSFFIRNKSFPQPDTFALLKFMHNRFELNLQQFQIILKNNLPQKNQVVINLQTVSNQQKNNRPYERIACSTSRKFIENANKKVKKPQSIGGETTDIISNIHIDPLPSIPSAQLQMINCSQNGKVNANQILNYKISAIFDRKSNIFDKTNDIDLISLLNCQQSSDLIDIKKCQTHSRQKSLNQSIQDKDLEKQIKKCETMRQKNIYKKQFTYDMKKDTKRNSGQSLKKELNIFTKKQNNPIFKMLKR